ncbi:sensor histidine kinase [Larkinella soli]|uniref:sensor histidine kinase n=1 Tax=Larkinella soli TaxID=1770527 RepID=UPI000FFBDCF0|nr:sensor histidine kinase [Larkinella soli]
MRGIRAVLPTAVRKRITFGFITALFLIALGFALTLYSYNQYGQESKEIERTYEITNRLSRLQSLLTDIETGARGYSASKGDPLYLKEYQKALPLLSAELEGIRTAVAKNPAQMANADSLTSLIDRTISSVKRQIGAVENKVPASIARAFMLSTNTRMDLVRNTIEKMSELEQGLLREHTLEAKQSYRKTIYIIFILSLLTLVTLLVSYNLLENELNSRQKTEDQLRAYEDELQEKIRLLEISNEELERFAFVASHDMQEPLRKIQSFGYLLRDRHSAQLNQEGSVYLDKILQSAERMSKMIKDLLNFSRISSKKEPFRPVRLSEVVQGVLNDQELKIRAHGAEISIGNLEVIDAVHSQMDPLFSNLISNALKFTKPNQPAEISIRGEFVGGEEYEELISGKKYYRITIEDKGIGFDEKYIDHIFKIFQRLHGKSAYEGTGIGLAICKRIVNYHKGYITARSKPGIGTQFIIVLPEKQIQSVHDNTAPLENNTYLIGG